jgi:hypothetical protein
VFISIESSMSKEEEDVSIKEDFYAEDEETE